MSKGSRRLLAWCALAAAVGAAAAVFAGTGVASFIGGGGPPPTKLDAPSLGRFFFGQRLVRAEIITRQNDDWRIDQGRVRAVTTDSITLRAPVVGDTTVSVSPTAVIRVNGRAGTLAQIRRGMVAMTFRNGDAPAVVVRAARP